MECPTFSTLYSPDNYSTAYVEVVSGIQKPEVYDQMFGRKILVFRLRRIQLIPCQTLRETFIAKVTRKDFNEGLAFLTRQVTWHPELKIFRWFTESCKYSNLSHVARKSSFASSDSCDALRVFRKVQLRFIIQICNIVFAILPLRFTLYRTIKYEMIYRRSEYGYRLRLA